MTEQNTRLTARFTAPEAKILIVDDLPTNIRIIQKLLGLCEVKVYISLSGANAIEMVRKESYDLILMDQMMPEMDGMETITAIRALEGSHFQKLPIVLITANTITDTDETLLQQGINGYIAKPVSAVKLFAILEKLLPPEKIIPLTGDSTCLDVQALTIPGVDVQAGLRNCGGSLPGYLDVLAGFCRDAQNHCTSIEKALEAGEIQSYITLIHSIKGSAWSIGAQAVGDDAAWLEQNATAESTALLNEKTAALLAGLTSLISAIRQAIQQDSSAALELHALKLGALKTALGSLDIATVNRQLREYTKMSLDKKTREAVSRIEDQILLNEYGKAISLIEELENACP